jgi:hypothetical protein
VTALLQPICLLLQLSALGFDSEFILKLLRHPNIIKVGVCGWPPMQDFVAQQY